jgi:hypothetical protein
VIAETVDQARDALEAIQVEYSPSPVTVGMQAAIDDGAPLVWDEATGNIAAEMHHGDADATKAAFAAAEHRIRKELDNQRVIPCPIEPRATLAAFDKGTGRITMTVSCQTPTGLRDELCNDVLGIPPESMRGRRRCRRRLRRRPRCTPRTLSPYMRRGMLGRLVGARTAARNPSPQVTPRSAEHRRTRARRHRKDSRCASIQNANLGA